MSDIRWKQRFQNYEKAFHQLEKAVQIVNPSETERAGMIQFFEIAFELAWKTMKDYLGSQGFQVNSPREAIKQAYQSNLIAEGQFWIEALDNRNLTVHTYDEATCIKIDKLIREQYFSLLKQLNETFKSK